MKAVGWVGGVRGRGEDTRRDTATARTRARSRGRRTRGRRTTRTRTRFSRSSGVIYNGWRRRRRWRRGSSRASTPRTPGRSRTTTTPTARSVFAASTISSCRPSSPGSPAGRAWRAGRTSPRATDDPKFCRFQEFQVFSVRGTRGAGATRYMPGRAAATLGRTLLTAILRDLIGSLRQLGRETGYGECVLAIAETKQDVRHLAVLARHQHHLPCSAGETLPLRDRARAGKRVFFQLLKARGGEQVDAGGIASICGEALVHSIRPFGARVNGFCRGVN